MNVLNCPYMDRLGRELIEAYRRSEDRNLFCLAGDSESPNEVVLLHGAMTDHRLNCTICKTIDRSLKTAATRPGGASVPAA